MARVREYFYVPHGPSADSNECSIYRRFSEDGNGIEFVGMWKGNDSAKMVVNLLNLFEKSELDASAAIDEIRAVASPVHSTKKAVNIATRVAELLGVDYAESTPDDVIAELQKVIRAEVELSEVKNEG